MRPRRTVAALATAGALLGGGVPLLTGTAVALPGAGSQSQEDVAERLRDAAGELEDSSAEVQQAAAMLTQVAEQLPAAEAQVAAARGEQAAAQATSDAAEAEARRAELARQAAQRRVDEALERVEAGRQAVNLTARRAYQQGPVGVQPIFEAGSAQDYLDRTALLGHVFSSQADVLRDLAADRLALAQDEAALAQDEAALLAVEREAEQAAARAAEVAEQAAAAAARVQELVAQREAALAIAEQARAEDQEEYRAAQAASEALAAQLRADAERRKREAAAAAAAQAAAASEAARRGARAPAPPASTPGVGPRATSTRMQWPANGRLTSRYGTRTHPIYGDTRFHAGIDIGASSGSPIVAGEAGTVVFSGVQNGYGNTVMVSHGTEGGREVVTLYAHASSLVARVGQVVARGETIARVGSTGNSTGPHLHFEVRLDGDPVDPLDYTSPP